MPSAASAFRSPAFSIYVSANFVSQTGTWIQRVAIGWLSWELTHSATLVGAISLLLFLPTLLLGVAFGALSDRVDVRAASIISNIAMTLVAAIYCLVQYLGWMTFPVLALLALVQGLTSAAYQPVRLSIIPELVSKDQLPSAVAINSAAFNLSRLLGPALSGLLIAGNGVFLAFAINAVSALPLLAVVSVSKIAERRPLDGRRPFSFATDLLEVIAFLRTNPRLNQQLTITALTSALGRGPMEMLPALAAETFNKGPAGLAWLMSTVGAGAMAAGLILAFTPSKSLHTLRGALGCAIAIGCLTSLLALMRGQALVLAIMFCLGVATTLSAIVSQTALQSEAKPELRGRIASVWVMISLGSPALAGLLLGSLADLLGLSLMFGLAGGSCLVCAVALTRRTGGRAKKVR